MKFILYLIIGLIAAAILINMLWRFLSQKFTLPCPVWLHWLVELDNPFTQANRANVIIENLKLEPGMNIVDIGCGPGRLTIPIAQKLGDAGHVVAMDVQAGMLDHVQKKAQKADLVNIDYLNARIGGGELGTDRFDRALLVTVLGEIPKCDRALALQEIFYALKPGGILSVTETVFDPHFQNRETVTRLALEVGFEKGNYIGNRLAFTINFERPS